jgi:hypothetical protein
MKLSIHDRLILGSLFPEEGGLLQQILVRDLMKRVILTQEEAESIKLREEDGATKWEDTPVIVIDVKFSDTELSFLQSQVKRFDSEGKVNQENLSLCERIMNGAGKGGTEDETT